MLAGDAGIVAADEVEPAVRAFHDAIGGMLAVAFSAQPELRLAIGHPVTVRVAPAANTAVAVHDEVRAVEIHPVRAGLAGLHEERGLVGLPVAIGVVEDFHVVLARDDDAALGIRGHREDVVREVVAGVERDFKAVWHAEDVADGGGAGEGDKKNRGQDKRQEKAARCMVNRLCPERRRSRGGGKPAAQWLCKSRPALSNPW